MSRYQKGKTNLDFTEARDSEWQWHHLGHMQVCTSLQTDNHASTPPLSFLQAGCPSCRPTNSVKALPQLTLNPNRHLPLIGPLQYPKAWFPAKRNARIACNATKILGYNLTRVLLAIRMSNFTQTFCLRCVKLCASSLYCVRLAGNGL